MTAPEILAPAGSFEAVVAAGGSGADAVYLGLPKYSARAAAQNFTFDDLQKTAEYCRVRGMKIYLAFNTLLFGERELYESGEMIAKAAALGVDAFIVQDLGAARLMRHIAPSAPLHASTQMSVLSAAGIEAAKRLGIKRVVLPRELSKDELSKLTTLGMETEVFVHGALCMSVSGQCYLSAALGGRSGNRGRCAGPCRLPFEGDSYALSLKDLSLVDRLLQLQEMGVTSLKIEGRLRRPEYVAAAVTACRQALAGEKPDLVQLAAAFSRSGFTSGYYDNQVGPHMFGMRTKDDVADTTDILPRLRQLYGKERPRVPVRFTVTVKEGEEISATVTDDKGNTASSTAPMPQPAQTRPTGKADVEKAFHKTLDTPFYTGEIAINMGENLFVPLSSLNALRRDCLKALECERAKPPKIEINPVSLPPATMGVKRIPKLRGVFARAMTAKGDGFAPLECAALPREMLGSAPGIKHLWLKLPRFGDSGIENWSALQKNGVSGAFASHLGAAQEAVNAGMPVWGDFTLNCANRLCAHELYQLGIHDITLSAEVHPRRIAGEMPGEIKIGAVVYGALPLMLLRSCPLKNSPRYRGCSRGPCYLNDRYGVRFPLLCRDGMAELYNSRPIWLGDRLGEFDGLDFHTLSFTTESEEECKRVIDAYLKGEAPTGEFTRGMYYQKIQ